jgi:hypothetical protein
MPDISIDIEDILDECSSHEIQTAVEWLVDNDHLKGSTVVVSDEISYQEEEFYNIVEEFSKLYYQISVEDLQVIKEVIKKY